MSTDPGTWVAASLTLVVMSFLWRPNKLYNLVQSAFVGLGAGYWMLLGYDNVMRVGLRPAFQGALPAIVGVLFGGLMLFRLSTGTRWLADFPMSFLVGIGTGIAVRSAVQAELVAQMRGSMLALTTLNNVIIVFGTIACTVFFVFTVGFGSDGRGGSILKPVRDAGLWILLVMLGAAFGNFTLARVSTVIARFQFLLYDWLGFSGG